LNSLKRNKDEWEKSYKKIIPVIEKQIIFVEEIIASLMETIVKVNRSSDIYLHAC
jgi:intergrase/recombinase